MQFFCLLRKGRKGCYSKCVGERMDTKGRIKSKIIREDPFGQTRPTDVGPNDSPHK